jgi:hypothetical protein
MIYMIFRILQIPYPRVWELLGRANDTVGNCVIEMLLQLEVTFGRNENACNSCIDQMLQYGEFCRLVRQTFESSDWETRFTALDAGFAIFLKLDPDLIGNNECHLWLIGSVVTFLVISMADEEASVLTVKT